MADLRVLLALVLLTMVKMSAGNPLQDSDSERLAAVRERLKTMLQNLNELNNGEKQATDEDGAELAKRQLGYLVNPEGRRPEVAKRSEQVQLRKTDQDWYDTASDGARIGNPEQVNNLLRWMVKLSPKGKSAINKEVGEASLELARERGMLEGAIWMYNNYMRKNLYSGKNTFDEELEEAAAKGMDEDTLKTALNYLQSKLQKRDHDIPFPLTADHQ